METRSSLDDDGRLPVYPMRVLRVKPGESFAVRILSTCAQERRVRGLFTHWVNGRSVYCVPDSCPAAFHGKPKFWKGYLSVDAWCEQTHHWLPAALEVTENLELDFRGVVARGQVWELSCPPKVGKKHFPVAGYLLEERDPTTFPHQFDLVPVLKSIYHAHEIDLSAYNPMPARTMVSPSPGAPPPNRAKEQPAPTPAAAEVQERFRERFLGRNLSPQENGHANAK